MSIGAGNHPERFDAKTVYVQPAGGDGVRITEVVDEDFGSNDRHGYQRIIPNDFGVPTDIEASSPDANADVDVTDEGVHTAIRLGDPDSTVDGQHRYVLAYTLPDAQLSTGQLALDIIGTDETLETGQFNVVVVGMQLDDPTCNVGQAAPSAAASSSPTATRCGPRSPRWSRARASPSAARWSSTDIGAALPAFPPHPATPARPSARRRTGHAGRRRRRRRHGRVLLIRRAGRNEVAAGGAADAAYATAARGRRGWCPTTGWRRWRRPSSCPPTGVQPWQGSVLLREEIGADTVSAWFSGLIAQEALTIDDTHKPEHARQGPEVRRRSIATTRSLLDPVVGNGTRRARHLRPAVRRRCGRGSRCSRRR